MPSNSSWKLTLLYPCARTASGVGCTASAAHAGDAPPDPTTLPAIVAVAVNANRARANRLRLAPARGAPLLSATIYDWSPLFYLEVNLPHQNNKQHHTRQNARKPRKTAKNKQRLTGAKNTTKPLINTVIQQPRWAQKHNQPTSPPSRTTRRQQDNHHALTRETPRVNTRAPHITQTHNSRHRNATPTA